MAGRAWFGDSLSRLQTMSRHLTGDLRSQSLAFRVRGHVTWSVEQKIPVNNLIEMLLVLEGAIRGGGRISPACFSDCIFNTLQMSWIVACQKIRPPAIAIFKTLCDRIGKGRRCQWRYRTPRHPDSARRLIGAVVASGGNGVQAARHGRSELEVQPAIRPGCPSSRI